jgi:putative transposase
MKTVPAAKVVSTLEASESPLPAQIQEVLGQLVGAAREGAAGAERRCRPGVVHELMELEVDAVVGPKGKHDADRVAKRHGYEDGSMTLGGRRVAVRRPRIRSADDERELPVATYEHFADRDPLTRAVMDRMLAGVSTRKFAPSASPSATRSRPRRRRTRWTAVAPAAVFFLRHRDS